MSADEGRKPTGCRREARGRTISAVLAAFILVLSPAWAPAPALAQAPMATTASPATEGRAFTPQDWYSLTTVSSPAMSPDGRHVAFTVTAVKEGENDRHSEVWMVPTAGGEPTRLTSPAFSSSNPRWSPDGAYLFFSSNRPGGRGNSWTLRMDRPLTGEAFQLEDWPSGSMPASGAFPVSTGPARDQGDGGGDGDAPASSRIPSRSLRPPGCSRSGSSR